MPKPSKHQTGAGTDTIAAALQQEIATLDERRTALKTALMALVGRQRTTQDPAPPRAPAKKRSPRKAPTAPRKRMRKARHGERQQIVLDAVKALTAPMEATTFCRRLGASRKQRNLYRATLNRQIAFGRVAVKDGAVQPMSEAA